MKLILTSMLILAQMSISVSVSEHTRLDHYRFEEKNDLVKQINWTKDQLQERAAQAHQNNNQYLTDKLEQEAAHLLKAIDTVNKAEANAWGGVLEETEYRLMKANSLLNCAE